MSAYCMPFKGMRIKKQIRIIIISFFWISLGYGQSQKSFEKLIAKTNGHLQEYSKLSPFRYELISLDKSGLPKKDIKYYKANFEKYDDITKDSISELNLILHFQRLIMENITYIISHKNFKDNKIEELLYQDADLSIVVSDDRKLFNISLDEKTGGTYRSRISITHYTEDNTIPKVKSKDNLEMINQHEVFKSDGFDAIYSIKTKEGMKYVLTGYVIGCSNCFESNIMVVSLKNGIFEQDFSYAVHSRSWEKSVGYAPETKTITIDYTTDDLTTDCNCLNYAVLDEKENNSYSDHNETKSMTKRCHCTFKFNGSNFELTKERWEKVKK